MEESKIVLSEAERRLISDPNFILTKNGAIEKIVAIFGQLADEYRRECSGLLHLYPEHFNTHPKISKGEKYKDLPWVILDYPRTFSKDKGHLAVRTFFWWGHFFSLHIQISGLYLQPALKYILNTKLAEGWLTGLTADAFDFNLPNSKWQTVTETIEKLSEEKWVLKMAKKIPIEQWESLMKIFSEDYRTIVRLMEMILSTKPVE